MMKYSNGKYVDLTQSEIDKMEQDKLENKQINELIPTNAEVKKAERQIDLINDLTEMGIL